MRTRFLSVLMALVFCGTAVSSESPPSADAAALQSIAAANARTAAALEVSGSVGAIADASQCTTVPIEQRGMCVVVAKAFAMVAYITSQSGGRVVAPPPQIIQAQRDVTVGERIVGLFAGGIGKIFDTAIALGPSWLNYKLGTVQSNNQTALGIVSSNNALGATQSTNSTFAAFGNNLQGTAASGFGAITNVATTGFTTATALGTRATNVTTITGNGNATNGSSVTTTTTTSTNNCPGGTGGNGTGANSGSAGTGPTGGTSGAGGTGNAGAGGMANCNAGQKQ